jgi:hypothetical protein
LFGEGHSSKSEGSQRKNRATRGGDNNNLQEIIKKIK